MQVDDIRVFVPSKDYGQSQAFYQSLGFELGYHDQQISEFSQGECSFILQNFYQQQLAENLMLQLVITDLDAVHQQLKGLADCRFQPPKQEPWGRVLHLWGLAGELWLITEFD